MAQFTLRREPLTAKQQRVLENIRLYIGAKGEPPTLQELRRNLGFKSLRTVAQYLESLERKGYIVRRKNAARSIELRENEGDQPHSTVSVPVVASVGCDNLSLFAQEERDEFLEVDCRVARESGDIVAVRAVGDSMVDAGIESGDYILVQFTDDVENGDLVAAVVGDMVVVKRLERVSSEDQGRGYTILHPASKDPQYKPIVLHEDFKVTGKVLCTISSPRADITEVVPL